MTRNQVKVMLAMLARVQIVAERQGKGPLMQAAQAAYRQLQEEHKIDAVEVLDYSAEAWAQAAYNLGLCWECDPVTGHMGQALA